MVGETKVIGPFQTTCEQLHIKGERIPPESPQISRLRGEGYRRQLRLAVKRSACFGAFRGAPQADRQRLGGIDALGDGNTEYRGNDRNLLEGEPVRA